MFFLYNMERRVTLHPSYFGRNMHDLVTSKLLKDVEGTCAGSYYIISIMDTFEISEGRILPSNGLAEFTVGYRAVVWRPFKGETVDAVVYSINPQGFFAQAGPLRLFVSAHVRDSAPERMRKHFTDFFPADSQRYQVGSQRYAASIHKQRGYRH